MQHSHSINAEACSIAPGVYERHRPEDTTLYQVISKYYPAFLSYLSDMGRSLPSYVKREFEDYLRCGQLEYGFLRVRCDDCFDEKLVAYRCKRRGFCPSCGAKRMIESSALLVDGMLPNAPIRQWVLSMPFDLRFLLANNPEILSDVLKVIHRAISSYLIKKAGLTIQTVPAQLEEITQNKTLVKESGFSLHAGVSAKPYQKEKIERLCRYITRPAVSLKRLRLSETGKIIYELKNPYKNGTTHVVFEPLDFIARLAALVPRPWMNLTRFHGVFAPNSNYRKVVTGYDKSSGEESSAATTNPNQRYRMTWAARLKRVFNIDITICQHCQGNVRIIACIKDKNIIDKILSHVNKKPGNQEELLKTLPIRGPPELVSLITSNRTGSLYLILS